MDDLIHGKEAAAGALPSISAVICTRNRGAAAADAARTVLANDHRNFELIVIDQSTDRRTADALAEFHGDPRFRYLATATKGTGISRNIGIHQARAPVIAFTDDDCAVPPEWLRVMERTVTSDPRISVAFCNVVAGEHDSSAGFIPGYVREERAVVKSFSGKCRARGMGAGMAIRRAPILAMGGFDEALGPGGIFSSAEDADLAARAIAKGQWVCETNEVSVVHFGFRNWKEAKLLAERDWVGLGAAYSKLIRAGQLRAAVVWLYELIVPCFLGPMSEILRLRRPRGLGRMLYFLKGGFRGLACPIDRDRILYVTAPARSDSAP